MAQPLSEPSSDPARILILGLGNDLLSDDAIGLRVAAEIRRRLGETRPEITIIETGEMGLSLLDLVAGFDTLILVDSFQTLQRPPGSVYELDGNDLKVLPSGSPHFAGIGEMLALGRELGLPMPRQVKVFAIEVADPLTVKAELSPALQAAFPRIVSDILASAALAPDARLMAAS